MMTENNNHWSDLLGPELLTKTGKCNTQNLLEGKEHVMLYFSAKWCPPCRAYTPVLSSAYAEQSNNKGAVIFVSSDKDEDEFNKYYLEMSFYALPYNKRNLQDSLFKKFKVSGIPTLVVLNSRGIVHTANARGHHCDFL